MQKGRHKSLKICSEESIQEESRVYEKGEWEFKNNEESLYEYMNVLNNKI